VTIAEAAAAQQVDRSTIMRIRTVAKACALAALAASKPGVQARERDYELEQAKAEVARLSEAVKEMAVKLTLVERNEVGTEWPGPGSGRRGHQGRAARSTVATKPPRQRTVHRRARSVRPACPLGKERGGMPSPLRIWRSCSYASEIRRSWAEDR
jgi:hypothetical protein